MAKTEKKPQMKEEGKRTNLSKELLEKTLLENPDAGLYDLAKILKVSKGTVWNNLKKHGIEYKTQKPGPVKGELEQCRQEVKELTEKLKSAEFMLKMANNDIAYLNKTIENYRACNNKPWYKRIFG
jgi:predicted transcriptional regulator